MNLKLKNGFSRMNDPQLETRANQILNAMDGNAYFPTPKPTIAEMEVMVAGYSQALTECKSGDRFKIAEKNKQRKTLVDSLHLWSYYVLLESDGDQAKATSSGFAIAPERQPRPPLTKPDPLVISSGINTGELVCKAKKVPHAVSYVFEYTTLEGLTSNEWNRIPSTKTKQVIPSLTRGTLYYCRLGAVGVNSQLVYSDVTSRTAA